MSESILDGIAVDVERAQEASESITNKELKEIAESFSRNVDELLSLLSFPLILLTTGMAEKHRLIFLMQAMVENGNYRNYTSSDEVKRKIDSAVEHLENEARNNPGSEFQPVDEAKNLLNQMLSDNDLIKNSSQALLYAGCSSAWSHLECVAKDTWVAALNSRPFQLGQLAISKSPDEPKIEGLNVKQISVGLLAGHGFDISNSLGTILSEKFDFTGVKGIRAAYKAAFGNNQEIENALHMPELLHLEATRHLIVHRAGIVDNEYKRRTGETNKVGTRLLLNGRRVSELADDAVSAGSELLRIVDEWLNENPRKPESIPD